MSKKKLNNKIRPVGKTACGQWIIAGVYDLHQTNGVPFEITFYLLKENNMIPDLDDFFDSAKSHNVNMNRLTKRVLVALNDTWGKEIRDKVAKQLD